METTGPVTAGIILAGGQSTRMGSPKALLEVGGQPLIERVAAVLTALFPEVLLVTSTPEPYAWLGLHTVPDAFSERRSMVGIYSGLRAVSAPYAFVCACDIPFLNRDLIRYMCGLAEGYDVVVPHCRGEYEPLHAVYGRACLEPMRRTVGSHRRNVGFYAEVRMRRVTDAEVARFDPRFLSFVNINTPEEYEAACRLAAGIP